MSSTPTENDADDESDTGDEPDVPEGVLRGIIDIRDGNTASKEDIESVLNY